jgi:3-dehydroquinate dehydratase-2
VLDGPNLNLLGVREPDIYGTVTLDAIRETLSREAAILNVALSFRQTNHEGDLIDALHEAPGTFHGVVLNPGGLTHTSVSLADAMRAISLPVVEVHLSNIFGREESRRTSLTAAAAIGLVAGFGWRSYPLGLRALVEHLRDRARPAGR